MPTAVRAVHGLRLYGWAFTGFLIPMVVGNVTGGAWADRAGPAAPFLATLGIFAVGLGLAGKATVMPVFVAGRAVQGFAAGALVVALYVLIVRAYDEQLRPRAFALVSAAWVLPGLLGPADRGRGHGASGVALGVLGPAPARGARGMLVRPALRSPQSAPASRAMTIATPAGTRTCLAVRLAVGVALVQWAGQQLRWLSVVPAATGVLLAGPALGRLLPLGTPRLRPGLPAAIGFRDLLAGIFFGAEAFLPLTLSTTHGLSPTLAGLPLTFGALGWFVGSWVQGHWGQRSRYPLVRAGFVLVAVGVGGQSLLAVPGWPASVAVLDWVVAGAGMVVALGTISVLMLELSAESEQGRTRPRCRSPTWCWPPPASGQQVRSRGVSVPPRSPTGAQSVRRWRGRPRPGCGRRLGRSGRRPGSRLTAPGSRLTTAPGPARG